MCLSLLTFIYFILAVTLTKSRAQLVIATCLMGFVSIPIFFLAYELLVALTPHIGEAMSCGILNTFANVFGFVLIIIATAFLKN